MKTLQVVIHLEIRADKDDDDAIKEAVYDRLSEEMESEELDFSVIEDEDDEDDSY